MFVFFGKVPIDMQMTFNLPLPESKLDLPPCSKTPMIFRIKAFMQRKLKAGPVNQRLKRWLLY